MIAPIEVDQKPVESPRCDLTLIGGGIVGLATAYALTRVAPRCRILLVEKEAALAQHQSGRNSGVIHSGLYYQPGTLKARLCQEGARKLIAFCQEEGIPHRICGKVVVAASQEELPTLHRLYAQGQELGLPGLSLIDSARLAELEPEARGLQALHVPSAGVVDFQQVALALAKRVEKQGVKILLSHRVTSIRQDPQGFSLITTQGEFSTPLLITCGGLYSDHLARRSGAGSGDERIVPFRGEYYTLKPERSFLVRTMIYPVPDPRFPFLGVHLTRRIDDRVEAGPNAVLALKREGYRKRDFHLGETAEMLSYPGFWKMAWRFWRTGLEEEYRSWVKRAFVRSVQRLVPAIQSGDLVPGGSGVRAQAVDRQGNLVMDFTLVRQRRALHVVNAPSPAATAALSIGDYLAAIAREDFGLR